MPLRALVWNLPLIMMFFRNDQGQQRWWRLPKDNQRDLAAGVRFFDDSSMDDGSIDEPLEKEAFKSSELSRIKIRSHMCWLTVVNALMLGITVALNSLGKTPWSIKDMNTCVKATSFYCKTSSPQETLCSSP